MKIRAAVLEATHGLHHMQELDLAPPGPGEVLVRLGASGVCRSDYNAIDGTTESPLPGRARTRGRRRRRGGRPGRDARRPRRPRRALVDAVLRRCGECVRDLPQLCSTAWPTMDPGGLMDGTTPALARRRAGLPLLLPLVVRRGVRPAGALVRADPGGRPVGGRRARRLCGHDRRRRRLEDGRRTSRRPCRGVRLRRRRSLGGARRPSPRGGAGDRRRHDAGPLDAARDSARRRGVVWAGSPEATAEAVREASGGGVDYAIEATGRAEAMLAAVPLDTRPRRRRPDRDPARGRRPVAAGAHDPPHGAADAWLDLRLLRPGARFPD